jgi:hypothetical protein
MSLGFSIRMARLVVCLACLSCRGPQNNPKSAAPSVLAEREPAEAAPRGSPLRLVRVQLVDCEPVAPIVFEETLPDGRVVESVSGRGAGALRLHLRLVNLSEQHFVVAVCQDAVTIVPNNAPRPNCKPPWGFDDWSPLPPGGSGFLYVTLPRDLSVSGIFTQRVVAAQGHESIYDWPTYLTDPISFELTPTGCRPVSAYEAMPAY